MGALTPIGNDVATSWENAVNGVSGAGPITHFDASLFKTQFACEVKGFNGADHFDRKKLRQLDLYAQYAVVAARQAVADAGLKDDEKLNRNRVGVIVAAGIGGLHTFEEEAGYYAMNQANGPKYNPFFIPKMIADIASGHISMEFEYHGPNYGVVSACASSNNAIIDAFNLIRLGKADVMVTGGAEAAVYPAGVGGFNSMHALSTRNDSPETASRPFSKSRDGFVIGEAFDCPHPRGTRARQGPRREDLRRGCRRRHVGRCLPPHRHPSRGSRRHPFDGECSRGCRHEARRHRLHQRARHLHPRG